MLRPLVGYHERADGPRSTREPPTAGVVLIVSPTPIEVDLTGERVRHGSFVSGLHAGGAQVAHDGEQSGVQVTLDPLAARRLLGRPLGELTSRTVDLDEVLGATARELTERVADAASWSGRLALVEHAITRRLAAAPPMPAAVVEAWALLCRSGGRMRVEELARVTGYSRRHLHTSLRAELGLAPKMLARLLRVERALALVQRPGPVDLARIALTSGYADQAHMNREVRALAGTTPLALRRARQEFPFVQDLAERPT